MRLHGRAANAQLERRPEPCAPADARPTHADSVDRARVAPTTIAPATPGPRRTVIVLDQ